MIILTESYKFRMSRRLMPMAHFDNEGRSVMKPTKSDKMLSNLAETVNKRRSTRSYEMEAVVGQSGSLSCLKNS
ncbi:hypothetical protein Q5O24_13635 [Eubacteriaceae bacterium ES3]|nr:hypothetical protein Q5O24_13635 [Eubacteriaceae bacterium ES3]